MTDPCEPSGETTSEHRLDQVYTQIEKPVTELFVYSRSTRRMVLALAFSIVFDLAVSLLVAFYALKVHRLADEASATAERVAELSLDRALIACESRNGFRALDDIRWNKVLKLNVGPPDETRAARDTRLRLTREFRAFLKVANAPEDCDVIVDLDSGEDVGDRPPGP